MMLLIIAGSIFINDAPPPYPGMTPSAPPPQQNGYGVPPQNGYGAPPQNGFGVGPQPTGYMEQQQPFINAGYPQQQQGPPPPGGYPQQQGFGGYPQAPGPGFMYPPPQNGYAFANGNQAFVPTAAPPPYDESMKKNN